MTSDNELLSAYASGGSEAAFAELVRRHLDFTYSTALRLLAGDTHLAQDVTQKVFIDLARHARALSGRASLVGWLHRSSRFAAIMAIRGESRRRTREQEASQTMQTDIAPPEFPWEQARPIIDDAIDQLNETEREAVLMRFMQGKSHREVGSVLGLSENTARMRVERALDKLRAHFQRRGIKVPASALAAALAANSVHAAPAGLGANVVNASLLGATTAHGLVSPTLKLLFMTTKTQAVLIAATVVAITAALPIIMQQREISQLHAAAQNGPRRPAAAQAKFPARKFDFDAPPGAPSPTPTANVLMERLLNGQTTPNLSTEQADAYVEANQHNAASLLAAYRATHDAAYLQAAMQKFSDDPRVAFDAYFSTESAPEERRQWLDKLKLAAPDNAMAEFLSAYDHIQGGQNEAAMQELAAGLAKPGWDDYLRDAMQDAEEIYRAAGYSESASKLVATTRAIIPGPMQLLRLGKNLDELAAAYQKAGDPDSAQAIRQMAVSLGRRIADGPAQPVTTTGMGLMIERQALRTMDPAAPVDDAGHTVQDRLNVIAQDLTAINTIAPMQNDLFAKFSDADIAAYFDRGKVFGELNALRWAQRKYGATGTSVGLAP